MTAGFVVKRERTRDSSCAHELGAPSKVGEVKYSRTFRTLPQAQREANAWNETGDWFAYVTERPR